MKFEDLRVWKLSSELYNKVNLLFNKKSFNNYFFSDQILRASLSISNNIAEGFERETNNELKRFLYIAKGSCGEVRSMVTIAKNSGYIQENIFNDIYPICTHISVMLQKYINTLQDPNKVTLRKAK